jgi:hypothetical protein
MAIAADLSIVAPDNLNTGKTFSISVNLDTDGVPINSVDITMSYPKDLLTFKGYKEEGSIKKLWLVTPVESGGLIHFSGIIPGGIDGLYDPDKEGLQPVPIIQLLFLAEKPGDAKFVITDSLILKNDGLGAPLLHQNNNTQITILPNDLPIDKTEIKDTEPPEPFTIEYIEEGLFSRTPSMVIFMTTDKSSGVEKYQMHQGNNSWKDVTSPLPTSKGLVKTTLTIRALDFYGNAQQAEIEIPGILSSLQLFIIIILCGACYFIFFVVKRRR